MERAVKCKDCLYGIRFSRPDADGRPRMWCTLLMDGTSPEYACYSGEPKEAEHQGDSK